jgi:hypothetical protein
VTDLERHFSRPTIFQPSLVKALRQEADPLAAAMDKALKELRLLKG